MTTLEPTSRPTCSAARIAPPAVVVVGDVVGLRDALSWFETKPLFGWRVLVPRTKEQAGLGVRAAARLRRGARGGPDHLGRAAAQPAADGQGRAWPGRGPLRVDRLHLGQRGARRCARSSRSTASTPAPSPASRSPRSATRPPPRSPRGACAPTWCRPASSRRAGLLEDWPQYDEVLDPINRVFLPRADIATETLVAGLIELGWEVRRRHGVPHGAGGAAARAGPRRDQDRQVRRGRVHVVLDGAQPRRHRRQAAPVDDHRGDRPGDRQDGRGARPAGRRAGLRAATSTCSSTRSPTSAAPAALAMLEAGEPVTKPSDRKPGRAVARASGPTVSRCDAGPRRAARGGCAARRRCVGWSPRPRSRPRQLVLPVFVREGADRAAADRVDAGRRAAHPRRRCARPRPRRPSSGSAG